MYRFPKVESKSNDWRDVSVATPFYFVVVQLKGTVFTGASTVRNIYDGV